jgi:hypothetical protein
VHLTIDNLDGLGAIDYTHAVDVSAPLEVLRRLNQPTRLKAVLCLAGSTLATPVRRGRVSVASDAGATLFTGYLTSEPAAVYAGEASAGSVYRLALSAVSDEWLLDKQSFGSTVGSAAGGQTGTLLTALVNRLDGAALVTSGLPAGPAFGVFEPSPGATWSAHAGAAASASFSAYQAIGGALGLNNFASVQHSVSDGDGSLQVSAFKTTSLRELANDVTVTGAEEPSAYWSELFTGDGSTLVFDLLGQPDAPGAGHAVLLSDLFNQAEVNRQQWQLNDPGSHLSLTGAGLTFTGGSGLDGQTTLTSWDGLELGGTLVIELGMVALAAGSAGVLAGLYQGATAQANCFAGFSIRQASGQTLCTPLINGLETGVSLTVVPGHTYMLRLRLHCPEMLRVKQTFYAFTDTASGLQARQFGLGSNPAPLALVLEARDASASSNTAPTVLYDGTVAASPASVSVVAVNSLELFGSMGSFTITETGSAWVRSAPASGDSFTRLIGKAADGADCSITSSANGHVTFFAGRAPAAGETVTVSYRGRQRAVARVADPASLAAEAAGGAIGTSRWLGHVVAPPARCQEDCENAAQAILSFAANRAAALSGSYLAVNPPTPDIWPGDLLSISQEGSQGGFQEGSQEGTSLNLIVRGVTVSTQGASPEALSYRIDFANDWAEGLGIKLSETLAKDALLPEAALELTSATPSALPPHVLTNLQQITVTVSTSSALTIDAGLAPPAGGGFEVRRRDGGFGTGSSGSASGDLVLRSPVRGFSIPIAAPEEIFFIRMYDASVPPLYSRFSAALVNHQPGS